MTEAFNHLDLLKSAYLRRTRRTRGQLRSGPTTTLDFRNLYRTERNNGGGTLKINSLKTILKVLLVLIKIPKKIDWRRLLLLRP